LAFQILNKWRDRACPIQLNKLTITSKDLLYSKFVHEVPKGKTEFVLLLAQLELPIANTWINEREHVFYWVRNKSVNHCDDVWVESTRPVNVRISFNGRFSMLDVFSPKLRIIFKAKEKSCPNVYITKPKHPPTG
jgi:hypothetical protein